MSASDSVPVLRELDGRWEAYTFHNESSARDMWRAPVSPYFHLIDAEGRVAAKGIASKLMHLDRLLLLAPDAIRPGTMSTLDIPTPLRSGA